MALNIFFSGKSNSILEYLYCIPQLSALEISYIEMNFINYCSKVVHNILFTHGKWVHFQGMKLCHFHYYQRSSFGLTGKGKTLLQEEQILSF